MFSLCCRVRQEDESPSRTKSGQSHPARIKRGNCTKQKREHVCLADFSLAISSSEGVMGQAGTPWVSLWLDGSGVLLGMEPE